MNPVFKRTVTGLAVAALVVVAILLLPAMAVAIALGMLGVGAMVEFGQLLARRFRPVSPSYGFGFVFGVLVLALPFVTLGYIRLAFASPLWFLYFVAVVKISDMGGFAFGVAAAKLSKRGTHKLCPTISPNKSWEGLFGSVIGSSLVSCAFGSVVGCGYGKLLLLGVVAALVGTFGDLVESKFKRWVGVKDSSTMKITNGMGGLLDMFDSLLFAPLVLLLFVRYL